MLGPGDAAPEFELEDTTGERFSLAGACGRSAVVLVFFKVSCPTCQYSMPFFERLFSRAKPEAPALIAVSQDDVADTEKFRRRFRLSFRTLIDPGPQYRSSNAYGIAHVPSVFLIEPGGIISLAFDGFEKAGMETLGRGFGVAPFSFCDRVPAARPG